MKPENVLLCVEDLHVRLLAKEALEWEKSGKNPDESAIGVDDLTLREKPDAKSAANKSATGGVYDAEKKKLTQNQKKKLKKKMKKQVETNTNSQQQGGGGDAAGADEDDEDTSVDSPTAGCGSNDGGGSTMEKSRSDGLAKLYKLLQDDNDEDEKNCKPPGERLEELKKAQLESIFEVVDENKLQVREPTFWKN